MDKRIEKMKKIKICKKRFLFWRSLDKPPPTNNFRYFPLNLRE